MRLPDALQQGSSPKKCVCSTRTRGESRWITKSSSMIFCRHVPGEPLARFIDFFWFYDDYYPAHRREHVLPDGTFELIIDLRETPRCVRGLRKPGRASSKTPRRAVRMLMSCAGNGR